MIKFENVKVFNFDGAFRGMRNPHQSWDKSDSYTDGYLGLFHVGEEDLKLALKLVKAGTDHSKFMRMLMCCIDITAPLYWWKEMDTYKISTVANSTSTMHTLGKRLLTPNDFSWDSMTEYRQETLRHLNNLITVWQETKSKEICIKSKEIWREVIQDLPSSFNQTRTWTANYQVLRNIYHSRKNHKISEWHDFCKMIEDLPYSELITIKTKQQRED